MINELLDYDEDLKMHYHLYQTLLESVKEKNFTPLSYTLNAVDQSLYFRYMKTHIKTILNGDQSYKVKNPPPSQLKIKGKGNEHVNSHMKRRKCT